MPLHCDPLQYPKTPKLTPSWVASGMALTTGVDRTDNSRKTNDMSSSIVRGVAGRSMMALSSLVTAAIDSCLYCAGAVALGTSWTIDSSDIGKRLDVGRKVASSDDVSLASVYSGPCRL